MIRGRLARLLLAAIGDDGTARMWSRLTPDGRQVWRLAYLEARELGHPCIADEHLVLGVLRHDASRAAGYLKAAGLELGTARSELQSFGPTLEAAPDPASALQSLGVDLGDVQRRLEASFGAEALRAAERRVRRRSRWRGGRRRPRPVCLYVLAKRSLEIAADATDRDAGAGIGPDQLLYGVLRNALDPLGVDLGRRTRRQLAPLGFRPGRPSPVRLQLEAHGIELPRLAAQLKP